MVKVPAHPQVTPRKWSKKTARIFDKQFDRFLYDELYVLNGVKFIPSIECP